MEGDALYGDSSLSCHTLPRVALGDKAMRTEARRLLPPPRHHLPTAHRAHQLSLKPGTVQHG